MTSRIHWVYLTTAPDQLTAELWRGLLQEEGFRVMIRAGDTASFLGVTPAPCRLMVPEERLEEMRAFLEERLGPETLT